MISVDQIYSQLGQAPAGIPAALPMGTRNQTAEVNSDGVMDFLCEEELDFGDSFSPAPHQIQRQPQRQPQQYLDPLESQIMNRRPKQVHQAGGFESTDELYRQFKLFILGNVSSDPEFDFAELLDVLADMVDMTELVASQRSRKRKVEKYTKGNKYMQNVDDSVYDELDDIDYE